MNKIVSTSRSEKTKESEPYFIHETLFPNTNTNFPLPEVARPKDIKCKKCLQICSDTYEFNKHAKNRHKLLYLCKICSLVLSSKQAKIEHLEKKHVKNYGCMFCKKLFWEQKDLNIHIKNVHYDRKNDILRVDIKLLKDINHSSLQLKEEFFIKMKNLLY